MASALSPLNSTPSNPSNPSNPTPDTPSTSSVSKTNPTSPSSQMPNSSSGASTNTTGTSNGTGPETNVSGASAPSSTPMSATGPAAPPRTVQAPTTPLSGAGPTGAAMAAINAGNNPLASTSLYVGDLHPEVGETGLYELFAPVGQLSSVRVCRDNVTRRSLGYAYVNFMNAQDAARALDTMNYHSSPPTKNRPIRLMWKHRDPAMRKVGQGNVFVKNLDKAIDNKALHDTFSQFGAIMSCKVAMDKEGQSLGYGFVHFETPEAAREAQDKVNGMLIAGKKVFVGPFLNRKEREATGQLNKVFTNIYVKNIPDELCSEEKVKDMFEKFGNITSMHIPADGDKVKGFAFINFENPDAARNAVDEMNEKEVNERKLYVGRAQKKSEREAELKNKFEALKLERIRKSQGVNLYVKNLSDDIDDEQLRKEFSSYGTITSCKIMRDDKGNSRGFGFVCFSHPDEATKAVTEMNGHMIGAKPVYVALAQRKEARRAQLEAMRQMGIRPMPGAGLPGAPGMFPPGAPFAYGQPGMMPQAGPGLSAGAGAGAGGANAAMRGGPQPGFLGGQFPGAAGRGSQAAGRGAAINPQYLAAMGRGNAPAAMGPAGMLAYGAMAQRQARQNRRPNGPANLQPGPGNMVGGRPGTPGMPQSGRPGAVNNIPGPQAYPYGVGRPGMGQASGGGKMPGQLGGNQGQGYGQSSTANQPLTAETLANASPKEAKRMLGEKLYPLIEARQTGMGSKLTGMLLEMENSDILHLMESPDQLAEQIDEAVAVLRQHAAGGGDQKQET